MDAQNVAEQVMEKHTIRLSIPWIGVIHLPAPQHLLFYAGLGVLAAVGVLEWAIAAVVGIGHALSHAQHSQVIRDFGEALEAA